jgi:hypothetical protein
MSVVLTDQIGEYATIDRASKIIGASYPCLLQHIRRNNIPRIQVGNTTMIRVKDLEGWTPKPRQRV